MTILTVSPAQYFVHLNSCVIRNLALSMTFDVPSKRPVHFGKTIVFSLMLLSKFIETAVGPQTVHEGISFPLERQKPYK